MATFTHPDLPGQYITGYSDEAAAILGESGWVDINAPQPEPEAEPKSKRKSKAEAEPEAEANP